MIGEHKLRQSADRCLNNIAFLSDSPAFEKMMANYAALYLPLLLDQHCRCSCSKLFSYPFTMCA